MAPQEIYRFGPFTLDVPERRLLSGTGAVRLSPKAFDVLTALVQQPGHLVTKNELLARVARILGRGRHPDGASVNAAESPRR